MGTEAGTGIGGATWSHHLMLPPVSVTHVSLTDMPLCDLRASNVITVGDYQAVFVVRGKKT